MAKKQKNSVARARLLATFIGAAREVSAGKAVSKAATRVKRSTVRGSNKTTEALDRAKKVATRSADIIMREANKLAKLGDKLSHSGHGRQEKVFAAGEKYGWSTETPPKRRRKKS